MKSSVPRHPTRIYFIRHGEVETRFHQIFGGSRIDMDLSPLGYQHAEELANWMGDSPIDTVYSSPMLRARMTAKPMLKRRSMEPVILEDLREVDFGDWTGFRWREIQERFGVAAYDWLEIMERSGIPNGESAAAVKARVQPCLQRILDESANKNVAVVCHGGVVRVALCLLLEIPFAHMAHFNVDYGSVTVIEVQPHKKHALEIELLNFCPITDRHGARPLFNERSEPQGAPNRAR
jgi:broad specificity phosphatase PhoE